MLNFCYTNTTLNAICNDEFYISEAANGANILTRIWNAIKRALEKIKNFFTKSKNPEIGKLENLTSEENNLQIETKFNIPKTMKNIEVEMNDSDKELSKLQKDLFKAKNDMSSKNPIKRHLGNKKRESINAKQQRIIENEKYKEERIRIRIELEEKNRLEKMERRKSRLAKGIAVLGGSVISILVGKKMLKKINAYADKLDSKESAIKRIINVAKGMTPDGAAVKSAENELKIISRIIATLNQALHELISKISGEIRNHTKKAVDDKANMVKDVIMQNVVGDTSKVTDTISKVKDTAQRVVKDKASRVKDTIDVDDSSFDTDDIYAPKPLRPGSRLGEINNNIRNSIGNMFKHSSN